MVDTKDTPNEAEKLGHLTGNGDATRFIHAGNQPDFWTHSPVIAPIYTTTTYETLDPGQAIYEYSRSCNPTRHGLEKHLEALESAKYALAFSSGLGSLTTTSYLLESGQHVLCCDDVYGGTHRFFSSCLSRMGIETTFVEGLTIGSWVENFRIGSTKMVWIESPTNPTMKIMDVKAIVDKVKLMDPECIVVVDNTFMTPIYQSPLNLGADIVMHSCTKFINGHSDVIMGALMTNNDALHRKLRFFQNALGIVPSPFDCSQVIRSIRTLDVRVRRQTESAYIIAKYLEKEPSVEKVLYPGLKSHPQHELAMKQLKGFGGMIAFYVKFDKGDESIKLLQSVKTFHAAVSLGCVCSLIQIPSLMTHSAVPKEFRQKLGMTDNLLRISVGLENVEDLIDDLKQAFKQVYKVESDVTETN